MPVPDINPVPHKKEERITQLKIKWLCGILTFFSIYAILRYIVFKGVDLANFPSYIVNKILSISGLFFLAISYASGKLKALTLKDQSQQIQFVKFSGLAGFSLSAMHVFISLILISPAYYPKFYSGEMMNMTGELTMIMGVFSLYCFSIPAITTIPYMQEAVGIRKWQQGQRMGYLGLITALLHVVFMGFTGWVEVEKWPGYMPPISLLGALIVLVPLFLKITKGKP